MAQINQQQMLPMGVVLGDRYRIVRYLASGGFGNTYVAEHTSLGRQVAIKEFFMRGTNHRSVDGTTVEVSNDENTTVFQSQLEKFRCEARRIFDLHNDHIIHVTDLFDANGTSYYVMDLVEGTSLSEQTRQQPLSEKKTRDVAMQVLDALETMHASGLYHLDVKPGNIMRDSRGHCTLIDFGASKQLTAEERATLSSSSMAYTPGYAPLEQVAQQSKSIGPWTDFFALGATLYKLVTGKTPPEVEVGDTASDGRQFPYPPSVSPSLRYAISTLMNPDRCLRPQTASEVRALLEERDLLEKRLGPEEKTVISDPTPAPVDEQTQHTSAPDFSPQPVPPTPDSSSNILQNSKSSQDIPDDSTPSPSSSRKGLWYSLLGIAAVILLVFVLVKGCKTKKTADSGLSDSTLEGYTQCPDGNHPHMIDLGLPSGTKWACCNVDADSPEDYGGYYAWGETDEKDLYLLSTYNHRQLAEFRMNGSHAKSDSVEYNRRLAEANTQMSLLNSLQSYMNDPSNKYQTLPSNVGLNDPTAANLINRYNEIVLQRNKLLNSSSEENPAVMPLTAQLDDLSASIRRAMELSRKDINRAMEEEYCKVFEICSDLGSSVCGTQYDVANVKWGGSWQMPTSDQIEELLDKCKSEWTTVKGVSGRRFTGPNGGSIFLPAAGYRDGAALGCRGTYGNYWSGTQTTSSSNDAYYLGFNSGGAYWSSSHREYGRSVRPVSR